MRASAFTSVLLAICGCDSVFGLDEVTSHDARIDAAPGGAFGAPVALPGTVNTTVQEEDDPSLTEDMLELYMLRNADLWVSTRTDANAGWGMAVLVAELNTVDLQLRPSVSGDGLTLYFTRQINLDRDIYVSTRPSRSDPWSPATHLDLDLNRPESQELAGGSSRDGLSLLVESGVQGMHDVYLASRESVDAPFTSVALDALNTASNDGGPWATDYGAIMFESNRLGTTGLWEAIQKGDEWNVEYHGELESPATDGTPWISPDGRTVVFSSSRAGTDDLYMATR